MFLLIICEELEKLWLCAVIRVVQAEGVGEQQLFFCCPQLSDQLDLAMLAALSSFSNLRRRTVVHFDDSSRNKKTTEQERSRCLDEWRRSRMTSSSFRASYWDSETGKQFRLRSSFRRSPIFGVFGTRGRSFLFYVAFSPCFFCLSSWHFLFCSTQSSRMFSRWTFSFYLQESNVDVCWTLKVSPFEPLSENSEDVKMPQLGLNIHWMV